MQLLEMLYQYCRSGPACVKGVLLLECSCLLGDRVGQLFLRLHSLRADELAGVVEPQQCRQACTETCDRNANASHRSSHRDELFFDVLGEASAMSKQQPTQRQAQPRQPLTPGSYSPACMLRDMHA